MPQPTSPTALTFLPKPDEDNLQVRAELADLCLLCLTGQGIERHADSAIYRRVGPERGLRCVIGARPGRACKYNCQAEGLNVYAARTTGFRWDGCTNHHGQHAQPVYPDRPMAYQLAF